MKKVNLLLAATVFMAASVSAQGARQGVEQGFEQGAARGAEEEVERVAVRGAGVRPRVEANHSVSVDLLGVHYAYELPVARTLTVVGRVGVDFAVTGGDWRSSVLMPYGDCFMAAPTIEIEPRWYCGLDRRERHGRSTDGNQGSFLSLRVANVFRGHVTNDWPRAGMTTFTPAWGLRRVWRGGWMMEFSTGLRFGFLHKELWAGDGRRIFERDDALEHLDLGLRFGYKF